MVVLEKELLDRWPAHFRVELAADVQRRIVDGLGVEPQTVHAPEITIVGINGGELRIVAGRLAVRRAGQNNLVEFLERLAIREKFRREPVE